jgi:hypothetical protein
MQEYEELKNEILDVIDERIASLRSELTSFKNEMIELFNRRTIDIISESRTALNNTMQKIDTTMADVEVKFNKANDDFKKASEILNLGEYNINAASLKSLFTEQSKAAQSIENLKGDIIKVSTEQSNFGRNIDEKITNMSTKVKNDLRSEVTLDVSKIKDEFRKTIEDKNVDLVRFAVQSASTFTETKIREVRTGFTTQLDGVKSGFTAQLGSYAKTNDINQRFDEVESGFTAQLGSYAKTNDINQRFDGVESGFTAQLGEYAKTSDINQRFNEVESGFNTQLGEYAKTSDINQRFNEVESGFNTQLGEYAKTSDINQRFNEVESGFNTQLGSYATKDYVTSQVSASTIEVKNWATTGGIKVDNDGSIVGNTDWELIQTGTTINP